MSADMNDQETPLFSDAQLKALAPYISQQVQATRDGSLAELSKAIKNLSSQKSAEERQKIIIYAIDKTNLTDNDGTVNFRMPGNLTDGEIDYAVLRYDSTAGLKKELEKKFKEFYVQSIIIYGDPEGFDDLNTTLTDISNGEGPEFSSMKFLLVIPILCSNAMSEAMQIRNDLEDRVILFDPKACLNYDGEFSKFQLLKHMTNTALKLIRAKHTGDAAEFVKVTGGGQNRRRGNKRKKNSNNGGSDSSKKAKDGN